MASSSASEIEEAIRLEIGVAGEAYAELREQVDDAAEDGAEYGRSIAPVLKHPDPRREPGAYRDSIKVEDIPDVNGMPAARILADIWYAHFIEYGTDTGTPEFGVFAKIAAYLQAKDAGRLQFTAMPHRRMGGSLHTTRGGKLHTAGSVGTERA